MPFYTLYLKLCNDKKVKPTRAGVDMGFSKAAITGWSRGGLPTDSNLLVISEYFGVPLSELMACSDIAGRGKKKQSKEEEPVQKVELTLEEEQLLRCWRLASADEKETVAFALRKHGMPFPERK